MQDVAVLSLTYRISWAEWKSLAVRHTGAPMGISLQAVKNIPENPPSEQRERRAGRVPC
jgi:hypothetical protein